MTLSSAFAGGINILLGLLSILLARPLIARRVRRNRWYGVRTRRSMASDEAWFAINEYGGRQLLIYGIALCVLGVIFLFVPVNPSSPAYWAMILAPAFLCVPLTVRTLRYDGGQ